jgi:hypothetical protein
MSREGNPSVECVEMQRLVPSYLDEELSETQSALLRAHLMDCTCCRGSVQELKSLRRWFVRGPEVEAPPGFAARVARRAFAGDTGERDPALVRFQESDAPRVHRFILNLTAAAAGVLFVLGMALRERDLPGTGRGLQADELRSLETIRQELEELNQHDKSHPDPAIDPAIDVGNLEAKDHREGSPGRGP